tara:strand:- start:44 stop:637 length:594 start_codon:yes stop_codon:yes gene_type:complete
MSSEVKANKLSPATGTDVTLGDSGDTFTVPSGATLTNSGTATGFGLFSSYAILREEQTSGTAGQSGTPTSGSWHTRVINTEIDPSSIVSISSNQFTLAAGNYLVQWKAAAGGLNYGKTRIYDVTNATDLAGAYGTSDYDGTHGMHFWASGNARLTPVSSTAYRIEHKLSGNEVTDHFGNATSLGTEVYLECLIFKEA